MSVGRIAAWLGGAVFVASLATCGWWYFVALGRTDSVDGGAAAIAADAALVTIFAVHHSLFAREAVKRRLSKIPPHLVRTLYVWMASLLLIAVVVLWQPIGGDVFRARGPQALAHVAVQLAGLGLIARAVAGLDPLELAGLREARREQRQEKLQLRGPYRLVRHPLYLGWILLFGGVPHLTGDRLAFAALTSLYLVIAIPLEERSLVQSFGAEYRSYRSRVRWRLLPFIY